MSTHVGGWEGFDLVKAIQSRFHLRVVMDRDSMVGALGDGFFGAGRGLRPLFYITLSTAIGGGLLTADGLYRGADSFAGELGHHTVVPSGPFLPLRLEWLPRANVFWSMAGTRLRAAGTRTLSGSGICIALRGQSCPRVEKLLYVINPARIVIGGGISRAAGQLFIPLRRELDRQMTSWWKANVDLVPPALGGESVLWGALALASELI